MLTAEFRSPLRVEYLGTDRWVLYEPLVYASAILDRVVTVPAGFKTDFASVPRWLPIAYAVTGGTATMAAVVHDWLYQMHALLEELAAVTRAVADSVFAEAMAVVGEPALRAWAMYQAVRLFGERAYSRGHQRVVALGNTDVSGIQLA